MCQLCRSRIEDALIEASRDPHLIAMILAGHPHARGFRERLRRTILDLRENGGTPGPLTMRLAELRAECPRVSGNCVPLLQAAATLANSWRREAARYTSSTGGLSERAGTA